MISTPAHAIDPAVLPAETLPRTRPTLFTQLEPGTRVRVTQYIRHGHRDEIWPHEVIGLIVAQSTQDTGSWFAHSPSHRVQLHRILLCKDDGEQTLLAVDERTKITILESPKTA